MTGNPFEILNARLGKRPWAAPVTWVFTVSMEMQRAIRVFVISMHVPIIKRVSYRCVSDLRSGPSVVKNNLAMSDTRIGEDACVVLESLDIA